MPLTQRFKKRNRSDSAVSGAQPDEQQNAANVLNEVRDDVEDKLKALKHAKKQKVRVALNCGCLHLSSTKLIHHHEADRPTLLRHTPVPLSLGTRS